MSEVNNGGRASIRLMIWATAATIAVLVLGPTFLRVFRPPADAHLDFVQEWLSARNFWAGDPVYLPERESLLRRTGHDRPELDRERPWNAHPPVAILVSLPFGLIADYRTAHLIWNLATFPLFLAGVALILRELRVPLHAWSICPALVLLLANNPVLAHLAQGQINFPVLLVLVLGWIAERRGCRAAAGLAVGLAVAIKLFPGLILVYFVAARAWRQALFAILAAVAANAVALRLFGGEAFTTYFREVLPSLEVFRGSWGNVSLTGYFTRVFASVGIPRFAPIVAGMCQVAIIGVVAIASWRSGTPQGRDSAFALAIAAMPLVSPVAWAHYFVILVLPLLVLWMRLPSGWMRAVFLAAVVLLLLPEGLYPGLYDRIVPGSPDVGGLANHLPTPPNLGLCAVGLAIPTLALATIFLLLAFARLVSPEAAAVEPARDGS